MLKRVRLKRRILSRDWFKYLNNRQKTEIRKLARDLKGRKIVHINSTDRGGGVAELLKSLIPYFCSLGIKADWYIIGPEAGRKFYNFTNKLHNTLQGKTTRLTGGEWRFYEKVSRKILRDLKGIKADIYVINDPQPLLAGCLLEASKLKIYYSHIDTSSAYRPVWARILPLISRYEKIIFSNKDFVHSSLPKEKVEIFTPAIDPLAAKQKIVVTKKAKKYLKAYGINPDKPLVVQVSRFDIWKDPIGLIEAFFILQKKIPEVQLLIVGFEEAYDNPQSLGVYKAARLLCRDDPRIFLYFDKNKVKDIQEFTNMAQNAADVVVQNSKKEGFGLTVAEAMWKSKAVVGGPASGIRRQIINGQNGLIADNTICLANKLLELMKNTAKRRKFVRTARKTVVQKFLMPRLVLDHLKVYHSLTNFS